MPDSESAWLICIIEFQYEQILSNFIFDLSEWLAVLQKPLDASFYASQKKTKTIFELPMSWRICRRSRFLGYY